MIKKLQNIMTTVAGTETALIDHGIFFQPQKIILNLRPRNTYVFWALFDFCIFKSLPVALRNEDVDQQVLH